MLVVFDLSCRTPRRRLYLAVTCRCTPVKRLPPGTGPADRAVAGFVTSCLRRRATSELTPSMSVQLRGAIGCSEFPRRYSPLPRSTLIARGSPSPETRTLSPIAQHVRVAATRLVNAQGDSLPLVRMSVSRPPTTRRQFAMSSSAAGGRARSLVVVPSRARARATH